MSAELTPLHPFDLTVPGPLQGAVWSPAAPGAVWPPPDAAPPLGAQDASGGLFSPGLVVSSTSTKFSLRIDARARIRRLSRSVKVAAHHLDLGLREGGFRYRSAMITATYAARTEVWEPRDITRLVDRYQQWGRSRGFTVPLVWVAELHKSGMVHYHLLLWVPHGEVPPMPDKQGWWIKGSTSCEWARNPVSYLAKYASKCTSDGEFPKGMRMHGRAGLPARIRARVAYALLPVWVKELIPEDHGVKRLVGRVRQWVPFGRYGPASERSAGGRWMQFDAKGWWRDLLTGECFRAPYTARFTPGVGVEFFSRPLECGTLLDISPM